MEIEELRRAVRDVPTKWPDKGEIHEPDADAAARIDAVDSAFAELVEKVRPLLPSGYDTDRFAEFLLFAQQRSHRALVVPQK